MKNTIFIILLLLLNNFCAIAQSELTVENLDNPSPGYLLLDSYEQGYLTLIDNSGFVAYKKKLESNDAAKNFNVMPAGLFTFNSNKKFYAVNQSLTVIDNFSCKNGLFTDFHDIKLTSSGHVYLLGVSYDTVDMSVLVQGGKPNATLLSIVIQEQDENKNVVWEWRALDHFDVTDATSDIDLTQQSIDWVHTNWMTFDSDGNLIISNRHLDEITKINRQTGDIIWRLGGKKCKNNQFTFLNDTIDGFWGFSHQHCVQKLPNGNLLLFDNGNLKPTQYSRAVEYEIDEVNKTIRKVWEYNCSREDFSKGEGSVQRLPNGNTIIGWGSSNTQLTLSEVMPDGSLVMEARNFVSYLALRTPVYMASKLIMVMNQGSYDFSDISNNTAVSLNLQNMTGSGFVSVERHFYTPHNISFDGITPLNTYWHRWVINNKGISNFSGKIIFKVSDIDSLDAPEKNKIYWRKHEGTGSFVELVTTYNQSQGTLEANISSFGEFIIGEPMVFETPILKSPFDSSKKNPTTLDFIWHKITGADSYRIQLSDNNDFTFRFIDTVIAGDTSYRFSGINNNYTYYWRLKSLYGSNESNWSDVWNFTTMLETPLLIKPVIGEQNFPVKGIFQWNNITGASNYSINISGTPDFGSLIVDVEDLTDTIFSPDTLDYNTTFYCRIKAYNSDNESLWSETNSFTTEVKEVLSAPILLSPSNDAIDVTIEGYLNWNSVGDSVKYQLELSLYPDFHTNIISENNLDSTSFNYKDLNLNTTYYWHVKAFNSDIESSWSETNSFTTEVKEVLSAPILLSPSNDAIDVPIEGYLNWNSVGDSVNYDLELSLYPDFHTNIISEKDIDTTSLYYGNLNYNAIYYWRVKAFYAEEQSLWSNVWMFTTKSETSVNNKNINEKNLQIYYSDDGKPAFIFGNCTTGAYHFGLFDIRGNMIVESNGYFFGDGEEQIILVKENLRSGLYIYRILSGYQFFTGKIII